MMKNRLLKCFMVLCALSSSFVSTATDFTNVGVHDPSVIRTPEGMYYIIGSHMGGAKSPNLIHWTQVGWGVSNQPYFTNIKSDLAWALDWGQTETFWAGDYVQLANGKYYMYYCVCQGSNPQGAIGYAVSDSPEGPFEDLGLLRRSSGTYTTIDPGNGIPILFDANKMPNCIDPHVFFDKEGKLWMAYGSYSGGIFILEMDPEDGSIKPGQPVWGTLLMGGNHATLEGAYILYSPDTDYYYLFISYGGLDFTGGYHVRVARSKTPNGPYLDAKGEPMTKANSNATMYQYGLKLIGNHRFLLGEGETGDEDGYVSPGHNSAYYDPITEKYYMIFHSRFPGKGDAHEVRVHQMFMNQNGWPVLAPYRYAGEKMGIYDESAYPGTYKMINFGSGVSKDIIDSKEITLNADHTITGAVKGTWTVDKENNSQLTIVIGGVAAYTGYFLYQGDPYTSTFKMTFTVNAKNNVSIWGSKVPDKATSTHFDLEPYADYVVLNYNSGLYMSVPDGSSEEEANVEQWDYNGTKAQVFRLKPISGGLYQLQAACSDYTTAVCVEKASSSDYLNVQTCLSSDTLTSTRSYLSIARTANGTYSIKSRKTNKALRVAGRSLVDGGNIEQYTYSASSNTAHWVFIKVAKGIYSSSPSIYDDVSQAVVWSSGLTIHVNAQEKGQIEIFDLSGLSVMSCEATEIEIPMHAAGAYIVRVTQPGKTPVSSLIHLF